jgi:outer membrane receptor protein involved in Fe transport
MLRWSRQLWTVLALIVACGRLSAAEGVVDLDPLVIIGSRDIQDPGTMPLADADQPGLDGLTLTRELAELPGLSLSSRGDWADEPIIRGLGFDRVDTSLNGLRLPNASPTRTHAPVGQLSSLFFKSVVVSRFLPSLSAGPPVSGGRIAFESWLPADGTSNLPQQPACLLDLAWHPERDGHRWRASLEQAGNPISIRAALDWSRFGNTTSGDGTEIPSHHESRGAAVSVVHQAQSKWRHSVDGVYRRQLFTENASLPLDTDNGQFWALTASHTLQMPQSDASLRLRYGATEADATLSNRRRPTAPVPVVTDTVAIARHVDLQWLALWPQETEFALGIDANLDKRDATRRRGAVAEDAIWPDIRYRQAGAYAQSRLRINEQYRLRLGARFDYAESEARGDDRSAFGVPLVSLYSRYNGLTAEDTGMTDTAFSANALLTGQPSQMLSLYIGAGTSAQIPPPTERYRAFLNALGGGFEVGNPGLSPERKQELVTGAVLTTDSLTLQADLFAFQIDDFIWRQRIGDTSGLLPFDPPQDVFGYRNVDAAFHGLELHGTWRVSDNLHIPFSL